MNHEFTLSYVLSTRNKLPYLREVMKRLLENLQSDEEIVITDGASTDGTIDFLTTLYKQGKIHQFISEPDCGEAHGFNKGILMARGELIKILTDDDIFYYPAIHECKNYMLQNNSLSIVNTHGGWFDPKQSDIISKFTDIYEKKFKLWLIDNQPFAHCGLGIMFRKSILPLIGLFEVGFVRADAHFSLKFTSLKLKFAWYTGLVYVRILNDSSNSSKYSQIIKIETAKLNKYYGFDIDKSYDDLKKTGNISKNNPLKYYISFKRLLFKKGIFHKKTIPGKDLSDNNISLEHTYELAEKWLEYANNTVNSFIS